MKNSILAVCSVLACGIISSPAQAEKMPIVPVFGPSKVPVLESYAQLGYQMSFMGENHHLPGTELNKVSAGGSIFHIPNLGGLYRLKTGQFKNSYAFADYAFAAQPVTNQQNQAQFNRYTHQLNGGVGYFFRLLHDRIELAPYLGMTAQLNFNDQTQTPDTVYYHDTQNRLALGLGSKLAVQFDENLPFPLFLFLDFGVYPYNPIFTSATQANFPDHLTQIKFKVSWYGKFLPYMGAELGIHQNFAFGNNNQSNFDSSWTTVLLNLRLEPELLNEALEQD